MMTDDTPSEALWIVQDVFRSGLPGPGFTFHRDRAEAEHEAIRRGGAVLPIRECAACGGLIGLEDGPLQGGCMECR